jgi:hypothetical protein
MRTCAAGVFHPHDLYPSEMRDEHALPGKNAYMRCVKSVREELVSLD